jgi:translation initiation factor IF-2
MTTKISLDASALNALFPPGSDALLELRKGVVDQFVKSRAYHKLMDADTAFFVQEALATELKKLRDLSERITHTYVTSSVDAYNMNDADWAKVPVPHVIKSQIRLRVQNEAQNIVNELFESRIKDYVNGRIETMMVSVTSKMVLDKMREEVEKVVRAELEPKLRKSITQEIKDRL